MKTDTKLVDFLNETLKLEYTIVIHMPKFVNRIEDEETKALAEKLASDSVRHADKIATIITDLGGTPEWVFSPEPEDRDLKAIFEQQLAKEIFASKAYQTCTEMTKEKGLKETFMQIVAEEDEHTEMVRKILQNLG